MNQKWIAHLDIDAFFASIYENENKRLKKRPLVVTNVKNLHGIVLTANYVARKYNIDSGMPLFQAIQSYGDLEIIQHHPEKAFKISNKINQLLSTKVSPNIFNYSNDEWFFLVDNFASKYQSDLVLTLQKIKIMIEKSCHVKVAIGCSFNPKLAKIATNFIKPDNICILYPHDWIQKIKLASIKLIPGIGSSNYKALHQQNIFTIQDLFHKKIFNRNLKNVINKLRNELFAQPDLMQWIHNQNFTSIKSISLSKSFFTPINDYYYFLYIAQQLAYMVSKKAIKNNYKGDVVSIQVIKKTSLKKINKQIKLKEYINDYTKIYKNIFLLVEKFPSLTSDVHNIGINLGHLLPNNKNFVQKKLF